MKFSIHRLISALVAVFLSLAASAGNPMLGVFSSPKGFGLCLESTGNDKFDSFSFHVDMYGLYSTRADVPGVKFNYSHNLIMKEIEKEEYFFQFYIGPGCSLGYAHDFEKGSEPLLRNSGGILAISCTAGLRMPFKHNDFCLDLSFRAEVGAHVRRHEQLSISSLSFYLNGVIQTVAPQLTILYSF